jgi:hypothetical protein
MHFEEAMYTSEPHKLNQAYQGTTGDFVRRKTFLKLLGAFLCTAKICALIGCSPVPTLSVKSKKLR